MRLNEGNRKWWTLAAMCFALFMVMLDNTVVNVALPSIQRDLHASISSLAGTVNAYTLTFAVPLRTGGRLCHTVGRRTRSHLRPPHPVPLRRRRLRAVERVHRIRPEPGGPRGRARGPGHWRGVHD